VAGEILDPLVRAATDFIDATGLAGVFVLMTLESACIPVPSEAIMLFAIPESTITAACAPLLKSFRRRSSGPVPCVRTRLASNSSKKRWLAAICAELRLIFGNPAG
jgi:hypothetical protein